MTNTINGRTPAEIKKGMECCQTIVSCTICPYHDVGGTATECMQALFKDAFELNSKLEYTLLGVMHSVDKWLDVEPYDFDKDDGTVAATRASNAREIALKAIDKLQKELQHERDQIQYTIDAANVMKDEALKLESRLAQVERERNAMSYDMHQLQGALCAYCKNLYRPDGSKKVSCKVFGDGYGAEDGSPLICGRFKWRGVCTENTKEG